MKRIAIASLLVFAVALQVRASERAGQIALGYQGLGFASDESFGQGLSTRAVDLRIWISDQFAVQPAVGLSIDDDNTELNTGARFIYVLKSSKKIDYEVSADVGIHYRDDDNLPDSYTDVGLRLMVGPEYFVTSRLSVQGDVGVGLTIYDDAPSLDKTSFDTFGDLTGSLGVHYYFSY